MSRALIFALSVLLAGCASTPPEEFDLWGYSNYEVTCDMVGSEGVQTMVVASFGRSVSDALAQARWNGVHAVTFKGLRTSVCNAPALVDLRGYEVSESWLSGFFAEGGGFANFVVAAGDVPLDVVYVDGGVKVFSQVSVSRNDLRDHLEDAGVIGRMGGVFDTATGE